MQNNGQNYNRHSLMNRSQKEQRLSNEGIFMSVSKKTEKITTALYMVTDLIQSDDPMRHKIRSICINLISDIRALNHTFAGDTHFKLGKIISQTWELVSLIEVGNSVGFISDMNYQILKNALIELVSDLRNKQQVEGFRNVNDLKVGEGGAANFNLKSDFFKLTDEEESEMIAQTKVAPNQTPAMSFTAPLATQSAFKKTAVKVPAFQPKKTFSSPKKQVEKSDRKGKIMSFIKANPEASIKDIMENFDGVSTKTIQRDLLSLISSSEVKKTGEKRWSRYSAAS